MTKRFDTRWRVSARYDEHDAMKAAVGYNTQMKLDLLWYIYPMQVTEERHYVFQSPVTSHSVALCTDCS